MTEEQVHYRLQYGIETGVYTPSKLQYLGKRQDNLHYYLAAEQHEFAISFAIYGANPENLQLLDDILPKPPLGWEPSP